MSEAPDLSHHTARVRDDKIARAWAIAFDAAPDGFKWEPAAVSERLVMAVRLAEKVVGPTGPRGYGKSWMDFARVYEKLNEDDDIDLDSLPADPEEERTKPARPTPAHVSEMEAALRWPLLHLKSADGHRRVLALWLKCKAKRKSFRAAAKRKGWSEGTVKRHRWQASHLIALALMREGVPAPPLQSVQVFDR